MTRRGKIFFAGFAAGALAAAIAFCAAAAADRGAARREARQLEALEDAERRAALELLLEGYGGRGAADFLDGVPGARGAAEGAAAGFYGRLDEILRRRGFGGIDWRDSGGGAAVD